MVISKLPDSIISRIAAGEVITSPYNVIKELVENSLDAGATRLTVNIGSTLKNISIRDNGPGICKDDLKYLCLNHYTSKISSMEDLKKCGSINALGSFGFRGEALHSISLCSHLKVASKHGINFSKTDKVQDSSAPEHGYMAVYNGESIFEIREVAFEGHGTLVEVNDIFYNNEIRKEKFYKNKSELSNCLELLKCYGCIFPGIEGVIDGKIILEPSNSAKTITSPRDLAFSIASSMEGHKKDCEHFDDVIKNRISYMLKNFSDLKSYSKCCMRTLKSQKYLIFLTDDSVYLKSYKFFLFINHRLVKNNSLKNKILQRYREIKKSIFPFVFIELFLDFVDVNVHPSKSEVLIGDENIIDSVVREVDSFLKNKNSQFQARLNTPHDGDLLADEIENNKESIANSSIIYNNAYTSSFIDENLEFSFNNMEEKDEFLGDPHATKASKLSDLNSFLIKSTASNNDCFSRKDASKIMGRSTNGCKYSTNRIFGDNLTTEEHIMTEKDCLASSLNLNNSPFKIYASPYIRSLNEMTKYDAVPSKHFPLRSLKDLKGEIIEFDSSFFRNMIFVGTLKVDPSEAEEGGLDVEAASREFMFVQHQTNLIKIEKHSFLHQSFYQKIVNSFGNFECKEMTNPQKTSLDKNLWALLKEYFSIHIEDGFIIGIPVIFGTFVEDFSNFSVVKTTERETLKTISENIAKIYTVGLTVDYRLFNKIKMEMVGTKELVNCCALMTDLKEIYKGFDRC